MAPPMAPNIFTLSTPDVKFVLAVVESPDRYLRLGYVPDQAQNKILDTYPRSGVYRLGRTPQLFWEFDRLPRPWEIHSFFTSVDGVHLVLGDAGGLRFYRNGELIREVDRLELFSAPWRAGEMSCAGPANLDVKASSSGRQPEIVVNTDEGSRFVFSARTGALLFEQRPSARAAVAPSVEEEQLAALMSDFAALARSTQLGSLSYEWMSRFESTSLHDCWPESNDFAEIAEAANRQIEPDSQDAMWLVPWRAEVPVDGDILGLARIRLPQGTPFALYRVPEGEAPRTLCGMDPLPARLLAEKLSSRFGDRRDDFGDLAEAVNGPTVLTAVAAAWEEDEEKGLIGLANVWRHVDGEWRILGFQLFSLPLETD